MTRWNQIGPGACAHCVGVQFAGHRSRAVFGPPHKNRWSNRQGCRIRHLGARHRKRENLFLEGL